MNKNYRPSCALCGKVEPHAGWRSQCKGVVRITLRKDEVQTSAQLSEDGLYRYTLRREWASGGTVCWVMLNPSTADATDDDPTVRKCVGYAKGWGYDSIEVVNLFALRATDPAELVTTNHDPVGPENDAYVEMVVRRADLVVCAWGTKGGNKAWGGRVVRRDMEVLSMIRSMGVPMHLLTKTKAGDPGHPLYLRGDLQPSLME